MGRIAPLLLLAALAGAGDPPEAVRANEEGLRHLLDGGAAEAVAAFERTLEAAPESPVAARNLAAALVELAEERGRGPDRAGTLALLERAVRLHPERLRYRVLLGRARFEEGTTAFRLSARADFAQVLERDPEHLDALVNLGQIEYLDRRLEEAVRLWRLADELKPGDGDIAARLARGTRELDVERAYETLETPSFVLRYAPAIPPDRAEAVLRLCEEAYGDLATRYRAWPARVAVTLYPPAEFRSATTAHPWVAGLSDGTIRLTVPPRAPLGDLRSVVVHELTHHFVRARAPRAPAWLHEGLAQLAEGRSPGEAVGRLLAQAEPRDAELSATVLRQEDPRLVSRFYDMSLAFTQHLHDLRGHAGVDDLLRRLGEAMGEDEALRETYGQPRAVLVEQWLERMRAR